MRRRAVLPALTGALVLSSYAGAANIQIILSAPAGPNAGGSYNAGQVVTVTCALRSAVAATVPNIRMVQIDYSLSTAGVVDVDSDAVDAGFPAGTITNPAGSNLLRWETPVPGPLTIPGSASPAIVFATFDVTMPATAGTSVLVNVLGPALDDGAASGAYFENDAAVVWQNGDPDAVNNITGGTLGLTTAFPATTPATVLMSVIAADPSSIVPAGTGLPPGTLFSTFDRPFTSPDGARWIMSADTNFATTTADEIIMVGSGLTGAPVVREGMTNADIPVLAAGQTLGSITERMAINDGGDYVFRNSALPTSTSNTFVIHWDGAAFVAAAHESEAFPGVPAGGTAADTLQSPTLNNAGTVGFFAVTNGIPAANNDMGMFGSTIQFQQGFIPSGQIGTPAAPDTFSSTMFYNSDDGSDWLIQCSLPGATNDDMFVVNGAVVAQEGAVPAGSSFVSPVAASGLGVALMMRNGDWFTRASNVDTQDWIMRNGVVLAVTDDPITPGNTELFDDATFADGFFFMTGNSLGDHVIGGVTNRVDPGFDAVLVLNGTEVIARQGDPIDLNGNGLDDDNAYIEIFNNDDGFLTDDLLLYFTGTARTAGGAALGQVFMRIDLNVKPKPCPGDTDDDGDVDADDLVNVVLQWGTTCPCTGDTADDGDVDTDDLVLVVLNWGVCR